MHLLLGTYRILTNTAGEQQLMGADLVRQTTRENLLKKFWVMLLSDIGMAPVDTRQLPSRVERNNTYLIRPMSATWPAGAVPYSEKLTAGGASERVWVLSALWTHNRPRASPASHARLGCLLGLNGVVRAIASRVNLTYTKLIWQIRRAQRLERCSGRKARYSAAADQVQEIIRDERWQL